MPPISCSRSAPWIMVSSPASSKVASQARKSCFGASRSRRAAATLRTGDLTVVCILFLSRGTRLASAVDDVLQSLRRDRQLRDRARNTDGVIDGRRDRRADPGDAALARALDAERVQRARRFL